MSSSFLHFLGLFLAPNLKFLFLLVDQNFLLQGSQKSRLRRGSLKIQARMAFWHGAFSWCRLEHHIVKPWTKTSAKPIWGLGGCRTSHIILIPLLYNTITPLFNWSLHMTYTINCILIHVSLYMKTIQRRGCTKAKATFIHSILIS